MEFYQALRGFCWPISKEVGNNSNFLMQNNYLSGKNCLKVAQWIWVVIIPTHSQKNGGSACMTFFNACQQMLLLNNSFMKKRYLVRRNCINEKNNNSTKEFLSTKANWYLAQKIKRHYEKGVSGLKWLWKVKTLPLSLQKAEKDWLGVSFNHFLYKTYF